MLVASRRRSRRRRPPGRGASEFSHVAEAWMCLSRLDWTRPSSRRFTLQPTRTPSRDIGRRAAVLPPACCRVLPALLVAMLLVLVVSSFDRGSPLSAPLAARSGCSGVPVSIGHLPVGAGWPAAPCGHPLAAVENGQPWSTRPGTLLDGRRGLTTDPREHFTCGSPGRDDGPRSGRPPTEGATATTTQQHAPRREPRAAAHARPTNSADVRVQLVTGR